jgi:hypothetical protein
VDWLGTALQPILNYDYAFAGRDPFLHPNSPKDLGCRNCSRSSIECGEGSGFRSVRCRSRGGFQRWIALLGLSWASSLPDIDPSSIVYQRSQELPAFVMRRLLTPRSPGTRPIRFSSRARLSETAQSRVGE